MRWHTALLAVAWCATASAQAEGFNFCDRQAQITAAQQDKLFRFAGIIKAELMRVDSAAALIARSGLNLQRFGIRYSHAGVALRDSDNGPWSVRQLYYACDERKPRIYDQGISGFLLGTDNPSLGYVSVVLLPREQADVLARAALDKRQALQVLSARYSANAYAFSERYQNCNQWLAELLAQAWGRLDLQDGLAHDARGNALSWLSEQGYEPSVIDVGSRWLMWAGLFIPFVHNDDHPPSDLAQRRYRISMPASIEAFVHRTVPQAARLAFCHTEDQVVVHHGWDEPADGCVPQLGDTVIRLD